jgi:hypothetical protein
MVEIITLQTIMINNPQNNFFFKDKGKEMRLQIHGLIEKKKKQININRYTMKNENIDLRFVGGIFYSFDQVTDGFS